ncbi:MAG: primosomal protein N' [Candidatus Omnitrophota bacterium]
MKKNIALVVVALPVDGPFDYLIQPDQTSRIQTGMRVKILFNGRKMAGYVVGFKEQSEFKRLNPVIDILDSRPGITEPMLRWTKLVADYYACSWGEILERLLPMTMRKARKVEYLEEAEPAAPRASAPAVKELMVDASSRQFWPDLIESVKRITLENRSVIILAPEKDHAGQIGKRIRDLVSVPVILLEKKLKVEEQVAQHLKITGRAPCVMIGTRSAVFTPCPNVGQIVILDAENEAYKEEQSPHYRADRVAQIRAGIEQCSLKLISSNPNIEHWHAAKQEQWTVKEYPDTATAKFQLVDMNNYNPQKSSILSFPLQNSLQKVFEQKGKALLYFNRKGFSTFTQCNQCGHMVKCPRCNTNLSYLYSKKTMLCRGCNFHMDLPSICPQCKGSYLRSMGMGIEKLESEVHRYYPYVRVALIDKDSRTIPPGTDIVLATSAILSGSSTFAPDLVAVLQYDNEINRSDFRCSHKALSVLIKLRQMAKEKFVVQTRNPDDQSILAARTLDFEKFLDLELNNRKELGLPPYQHLAAITVRGEDEVQVLNTAVLLSARFKEQSAPSIEVLDPYPDVRAKLRDQYRYIIMLKSKSAPGLIGAVRDTLKNFKHKRNIIVSVNVDP